MADPDYELNVLLREELDRQLSGLEDIFGRCWIKSSHGSGTGGRGGLALDVLDRPVGTAAEVPRC